MAAKKRNDKPKTKSAKKMSWGRKIAIIFLLVVGLYLIARYYNLFGPSDPENVPKYDRVLIWWTQTLGKQPEAHVRQCGPYQCLITENQKFRSVHRPKAFLFDGSKFHISDMPLPRDPKDLWGLYYNIGRDENDRSYFSFEETISLFNFTSTFSRFSDVPLTLRYLNDLGKITAPPEEDGNWTQFVQNKVEFRKMHAPVVSYQEFDAEEENRDVFMEELSALIGHEHFINLPKGNNSLPEWVRKGDSPEERRKNLINFIKQYKFMLIYEESMCLDFISMQFWLALEAGVVPIYFGPKTTKDWVPNQGSVIFVKDFDNIEKLVELLKDLDEDMDKYLSYLDHKSKGKLTNQNLVDFIERRSPLVSDYKSEFECFVCTKLTEEGHFKADLRHLDCSEDSMTDTRTSRCSYKAMHALAEANELFTSDDVAKQLEKFATNKEC